MTERDSAFQLILRVKYKLDIEIRGEKEKLETNLTNKSSPKFKKKQAEPSYI